MDRSGHSLCWACPHLQIDDSTLLLSVLQEARQMLSVDLMETEFAGDLLCPMIYGVHNMVVGHAPALREGSLVPVPPQNPLLFRSSTTYLAGAYAKK